MIVDINSHTPKRTQKFFLDANIWFFMFCPLANSKKNIVEKYSAFFRKIIQTDGEIYTSSGIISEFVNRYLKLDHALNKKEYPDYKRNYRSSSCYTNTFSMVNKIVNDKILKCTTRLSDGFEHLDIEDIMNEAEATDFNDSLFSNMLKSKNIAVLTDDGDFYHLKSNHDIYTGNSRLLARGKEVSE